MIEADFEIVHAGQLVCIGTQRHEDGPRRRAELSSLTIINDGALASRNGEIVWAGETDRVGEQVVLTADEGPLSTRDYRVVLEAVAVDDGATFTVVIASKN